MGVEAEDVAKAAMFFAGLILLIPHRIGMSRVNYVIKRYNLPISRAGLLLYKFHNPIEVSLTIGTLGGNLIVWFGGGLFGEVELFGQKTPWQKKYISGFMIIFLILMFLSSIFMFIIYVLGDDYGHLNAFYFSLILITLFDGFTNAFAFGLNAKEGASLLSAGIPISGLLISLLHYIYKFFFDLFHWDDFDYYVLRLQLICNILTLLANIGLWSWDFNYKKNDSNNKVKVGNIMELFSTHVYDWVPIFMLAISLGTVYAFYPSIAPYSIIDYQYASIIELWILIISALLPFVIALLDTEYPGGVGQWGPSGKSVDIPILSFGSGATITVDGANAKNKVNFSGQTIQLSDILIKHPQDSDNTKYHKGGTCSQSAGDPLNNWHNWNTIASKNTVTYTLDPSDQYWDTTAKSLTDQQISITKPSSPFKYKYYSNWFQKWNLRYKSTGTDSTGSTTITLHHDDSSGQKQTTPPNNGFPYDKVKYTVKTTDQTPVENTTDPNYYSFWNLVWICAIFYILCIQIFMTLLHYPHCLLSCLFNNNPYAIVFISILFNTLRELMQATAFSGAGKQCINSNPVDSNTSYFGSITFPEVNTSTLQHITPPTGSTGNANISPSSCDSTNKLKLTNINASLGDNLTQSYTGIYATVSAPGFKIPKNPTIVQNDKFNNPIPLTSTDVGVNGTISATNKLITLFVMMFCVFTGDGYLQHYRRCCRDNWPTTGYNKYQSFFYWLRYGFKGGIKSITSSFTDLYYHNLRPQFISYA